MHQRPAHVRIAHHANGLACQRVAGKATEDTSVALVHHGGMNDERLETRSLQNPPHVLQCPCEGRQWR